MKNFTMRNNRRIMIGLAAALALGVAGTSALAQTPEGGSKKNEPLRPPVPPAPNNTSAPFGPLLIGIALAAIVAGVAFIPSKRGHQD